MIVGARQWLSSSRRKAPGPSVHIRIGDLLLPCNLAFCPVPSHNRHHQGTTALVTLPLHCIRPCGLNVAEILYILSRPRISLPAALRRVRYCVCRLNFPLLYIGTVTEVSPALLACSRARFACVAEEIDGHLLLRRLLRSSCWVRRCLPPRLMVVTLRRGE